MLCKQFLGRFWVADLIYGSLLLALEEEARLYTEVLPRYAVCCGVCEFCRRRASAAARVREALDAELGKLFASGVTRECLRHFAAARGVDLGEQYRSAPQLVVGLRKLQLAVARFPAAFGLERYSDVGEVCEMDLFHLLPANWSWRVRFRFLVSSFGSEPRIVESDTAELVRAAYSTASVSDLWVVHKGVAVASDWSCVEGPPGPLPEVYPRHEWSRDARAAVNRRLSFPAAREAQDLRELDFMCYRAKYHLCGPARDALVDATSLVRVAKYGARGLALQPQDVDQGKVRQLRGLKEVVSEDVYKARMSDVWQHLLEAASSDSSSVGSGGWMAEWVEGGAAVAGDR